MRIEIDLTANELAEYVRRTHRSFDAIVHTLGKRLQRAFKLAREDSNRERRITAVRRSLCLHESRGQWVCIGKKGHEGKHTFTRGTRWSVR